MKHFLLPLILIVVLLCFVLITAPYNFVGDYRAGEPEDGQLPDSCLTHNCEGGASPPSGGGCGSIGQTFPDNLFSGWPVPGWHECNAWVISSPFCEPRGEYTHWGIDIARTTFEESVFMQPAVSNTYKAEVIAADWSEIPNWNHGMGNYVMIEALECEEICTTPSVPPDDGTPWPPQCEEICEPSGWVATYMHFAEIAVSVGAIVDEGDVLGYIDSTGNSDGHHLHYQINGPGLGAIDPAPAICPDGWSGGRPGW